MKNILFLTFIVFFGCNNIRNNKPAQSATPSSPKNFERVIPPAIITDSRERANFMVTHFWDHFNFKDTMYAHAPDITEQAFVDFLSFFQYASPGKIQEGVTKLMKSAEADRVMFAYFARESEHYLYDPNSSFRNDEYFIPFLEQIMNTSMIDEAHKVRPRYLLNLAYKNRPGDRAADLQYTLASGKTGNLYAINAKYLLLMFYNPGCSECQNTMKMIRNSAGITLSIKNGKVKVLAVYPDENIDKWKEYTAEVPLNWINSYDKSLNIREKEIYDLKAIPTLYLLDKDKNVILKDCSVEEINEFLKSQAA
jgi:hypothetical protein